MCVCLFNLSQRLKLSADLVMSWYSLARSVSCFRNRITYTENEENQLVFILFYKNIQEQNLPLIAILFHA